MKTPRGIIIKLRKLKGRGEGHTCAPAKCRGTLWGFVSVMTDACVTGPGDGRLKGQAGQSPPTGPRERPATALGLESPQDTALVMGQNQPWTHGSSWRDKIQLPKDQTVNKFATEQGSSQNKTQQYILIPSLNGLKHSVWNPIKNYQA